MLDMASVHFSPYQGIRMDFMFCLVMSYKDFKFSGISENGIQTSIYFPG